MHAKTDTFKVYEFQIILLINYSLKIIINNKCYNEWSLRTSQQFNTFLKTLLVVFVLSVSQYTDETYWQDNHI
jgi:hypothetical protein